jgi:hypothetical protein
VQTHGQRLGQGTAGIRNRVRQPVAHGLRVIGELHKRSVQVREGLCTAAEAHVRAEIVSVLQAQKALLAGDADLHGHAIAHFQRLHVRSDGRYDAGGLVAERHGLPHHEVAIAAVCVVMKVGTAETRGSNSDLDFCTGRGGYLTRFLVALVSICVAISMNCLMRGAHQSEILGSMKDQCLAGFSLCGRRP